MYKIICIDGKIRATVDEHGKANKYGRPKLLGTYKQAKRWVDQHSYKGMSFKYVINEVSDEEVAKIKRYFGRGRT
jgi:hypothetical protein